MNRQRIVDRWVNHKTISVEGGVPNLFMLEMLIEMVKARKDGILVDMEKAYYRMNMNNLD